LLKKKRIMKKILSAASMLALLAMPVLALAQFSGPTEAPPIAGTIEEVFQFIQLASSWFLGILIALAVIFLLYSAFLYLTSGGDDTKVKSAKNYLVYALIAVAIGLVARGLILLVGSFFGVSIG